MNCLEIFDFDASKLDDMSLEETEAFVADFKAKMLSPEMTKVIMVGCLTGKWSVTLFSDMFNTLDYIVREKRLKKLLKPFFERDRSKDE